MSSLYTTKQAAELGEKLREYVADSTLIRMMAGFFYFSGLKSFHEPLATNGMGQTPTGALPGASASGGACV